MPRPAQPLLPLVLASWVVSPLACKGEEKAGVEPAPAAAPASSEAKAPVEHEAPAEEGKAAADSKAPAQAGPPDEWLVWSLQGDRLTTRWIDASKPGDGLVAERKALIVSDGTALLRAYRSDGVVDVLDYECLERDTKCEVTGTLAIPGIVASDLVSKAETGPHRVSHMGGSDGSPIHGDGITLSLEVVGGAGSQLWVREHEDGYYGGVHGEVSEGTMIFDAKDGAVTPMFERLAAKAAALPAPLLKEAAEEIRKALEDCDDDVPPVQMLLDEGMELSSVRNALVDGKLRQVWEFTAETFFACSSDYLVHVEVSSEPQTVAALGVEALPPGVLRAMTHLDATSVLGWSKLSLEGEARAAALAAFQRASEDPWPPSQTSDRPVAKAAPEHGDAMALVAKGRRATRAKDYEEAIVAFDDAIAFEKDLPSAWAGRGYAKLLAGQLDGAEADLNTALTLDDGAKYQAMVLYNLGLLAEKRGDVEAAKRAYTDSLALRDNKTVRQVLDELGAK